VCCRRERILASAVSRPLGFRPRAGETTGLTTAGGGHTEAKRKSIGPALRPNLLLARRENGDSNGFAKRRRAAKAAASTVRLDSILRRRGPRDPPPICEVGLQALYLVCTRRLATPLSSDFACFTSGPGCARAGSRLDGHSARRTTPGPFFVRTGLIADIGHHQGCSHGHEKPRLGQNSHGGAARRRPKDRAAGRSHARTASRLTAPKTLQTPRGARGRASQSVHVFLICICRIFVRGDVSAGRLLGRCSRPKAARGLH